MTTSSRLGTMRPTMAFEAAGELRRIASGWEARITIEGRNRRGFALAPFTHEQEPEARERCKAMAQIAARLRKAGKVAEVEGVLELAALARPGREWTNLLGTVDALCGGRTVPLHAIPTFEKFAERWTSGALAKAYPDHVKAKDTHDRDEYVLEKYVNPEVGPTPMHAFTLEHAERVMAKLPERLSAASRRHVAQVVHRVCVLAVYPAKLLQANPIPRGWLPKLPPRKAMACLYPDEDKALLGCRPAPGRPGVPLLQRLVFGILAREGMRRGELFGLRWTDVDLERGMVRLDENKTDDPRAWVLDPGVVRALKAWKERFRPKAKDSELVIDDGAGEVNEEHLAEQLRRALEAAGIKRPELFDTTPSRLRMRAHDLRATFITCALANGKTETWVADRTGHKSSGQINGYRRQARTWSEANLGELAPLDQAIPELRPLPHTAPRGGKGGSGRSRTGEKPRTKPGTPKTKEPRSALGSGAERRKGSSPFSCT